MAIQKVMMIGDVVGEGGLAALEALLPGLIDEYAASLVLVNGENAADGFGMTEAVLARILSAGADVVSSGNHVWEKRDFWPILESEARVIRPANYPAGAAGRGWTRIDKAGVSWLTVNLQGRDLMSSIDCPFKTFDGIYASQVLTAEASPSSQKPLIIVDFHAETSREKESLAYYLDGRASLVAGTHTHVQTADERILPKGCGYITDLGMTGVNESIIGMDIGLCLDRVRTQVPYRMECAAGEGTVQGIIAGIDSETGFTVSIERISRH
ncbi:YmdB family metallophosphoesterase [Treponema sp. OttesenSCG-928-L16]|nr:YmdB family metallophosphoesterase [Treponema sp. OttesenSCG-928-L16]